MSLLNDTIARIGDLLEDSMKQAQDRQTNLIKPPGSLGVLEDLSIQLAGITGQVFNKFDNKAIIVMGGDHGIYEEGINNFPQAVTAIMMTQFAEGGAGVAVLGKHVGAKIVPVDIGVAVPVDHPGVINRKVKAGTDNISKGPAMTREEAVKALEVGIDIANDEIDKGVNLLGTGDMGLCNTSPSSALMAVFGGIAVSDVTGRGTGIDDETLAVKVKLIEKAIQLNQPDKNDPLDVLAKVGGLEIAGIAGVILGAAARRVPVVIDGFISSAGALLASRLAPKSINFMIASHCSAEHAHRMMLEVVGLRPMLDMKMRLGEGTGTALTMNIIDAAEKIISDMATFADLGMA